MENDDGIEYIRDSGIELDFTNMIDLNNPSPPIGMSVYKFHNWIYKYGIKYGYDCDKFGSMFLNLYKCRHDNRMFYERNHLG